MIGKLIVPGAAAALLMVTASAAFARGQAELEECMVGPTEQYNAAMRYCVERVAPQYGVSSWEYEICDQAAYQPYYYAELDCWNMHMT